MIDKYLNYLQEEKKIISWLKRMGIAIKDMYVENKECKYIREEKQYIFLFHGTRQKYVKSIKKHGLLVSMAGKRSDEEGDFNMAGNQKLTWFISVYNPKRAGFGHFGDDPVVGLIAKLNTKYLKNTGGVVYTYNKDIPVKDIIWQDNNRFKKIVKSSKCLKEIK